jgi:hypothetical protein
VSAQQQQQHPLQAQAAPHRLQQHQHAAAAAPLALHVARSLLDLYALHPQAVPAAVSQAVRGSELQVWAVAGLLLVQAAVELLVRSEAPYAGAAAAAVLAGLLAAVVLPALVVVLSALVVVLPALVVVLPAQLGELPPAAAAAAAALLLLLLLRV